MGILISAFCRYKRSIKNMGFYFTASLVPMVISLVLSPVYAMYLKAADYAIIGFYSSFSTLLAPLILFYLNQYYMREYFYRDEKGKIELRAMIFKVFVVMPFILLALCLVGIYIYMTIFNAESDIPFFPYAILSLLPLSLVGLYRLELIDYKVQRQGKQYFVISVLNSVIVAVFSLLFVVVLNWGATGRLLGLLVAPAAIFIWSFYRHKDLLKVRIDWKKLREAIVFCAPLVLASMMGFFTHGYDKVRLEKIVEIEQLGYYSIGITIAGYLSVFSTAISDTFSPDIFESLAKKDFKRMFKYTGVQIGMMLFIVLVFALAAKPLIWVFTAGRYVEAAPYARIASLGALTAMLYGITSNVVMAYKKTFILLWSKILGGLLCVISYSILISNFTLSGAAWGSVLSNVYFAIFAIVFLLINIRNTKKNLH